jgi:Putative beta-lactamase-inhibitor-like, PepSY-like
MKENAMRRVTTWLGAAAMAGLALTVAASRADDKKISPDDLPAKVKEALNHRFPGAKVTSAEKEIEKGQVVYDLELKHDGRKYEMDVKEDGTILEIEKEIPLRELPAAVAKALKDHYPKD